MIKESYTTQTLELLESTNKIANIGVFQYQAETNSIYWNDVLKSIYQVPIDFVPTLDNIFNYISEPKDQALIKKICSEVLKTEKSFDFKHEIVTGKGNHRFLHVLGESVFKENRCIYIQGALKDVTELEKSKKELIQKKRQLNIAANMVNLGYWRWDVIKNEETWSDNLYDIFEREKGGTLRIETYLEYVHPEDISFVEKKIEQTLCEKRFIEFSHRIVLKNGTVKTIVLAGQVITDYQERVVEMVGTCQDITEDKVKEYELLEINQLLDFAEQLTAIGYWRWKPANNEVFWSDSLYKNFERPKNENIYFETYFDYVHPGDKEFVKEKLELSIKEEKFHDFIHRVLLPSGKIKTFQINGVINKKSKNSPLELLGTCLDITESEIKSLEITKKNQQLRIAENLAMIGYWQWNPTTNVVTWSDNLYKIYEHKKSDPVNFEVYIGYIHKDDKSFVSSNIEATLADKNFRDSTYRLQLKNGKVKTIKSVGKVITNKKGEIIEMLGICQDITTDIRKEQELIQKNQRLNEAEQLAMAGSWFYNPKTEEFKCSNNLYCIYDFKEGSSLNFNKLLKRIHPEDLNNAKAHFDELKKTKILRKFVSRIILRNGSIRTIEIAGKVNAKGHVIGTSRDITIQLQAQQEILESNKKLENSTFELIEKNNQLAEFNQITSHNLRTPVSNLNSLLELWRGTEDVNLKAQLFDKFEIVVNHLTLTLDSLVQTLNISNNSNVIIDNVSFEETLNKTKEILVAEIINTGAIIKHDFTSKKSIQYSKIYLESIFLNLISNALKYKSPNRIPKIIISSNVVDGKTILTFKDNGLGIDLKKHGHKLFGLYKVFHRHPKAQGLGLFLTKAQIVAMGGSIEVQSKVNVGTSFIITL